MRITDTVDLNRQGVLKAADMVPTADTITVGVVIVALAHNAVMSKTAIMSPFTEDRHVGDSVVVVVPNRPMAISPRDNSRQTDTRRVSNAVITDTHTRMIVQPSIRSVTDVAKRITSGAFVEVRIGPRPYHNDGRVVLVWVVWRIVSSR